MREERKKNGVSLPACRAAWYSLAMTIDQDTIDAMASAGIRFIVEAAAPWGGITLTIRADQVPGIVADRDQGIADHLGVLKNQYLDWLQTEGLPRCGATTAKGERCRNSVSGGIQRPLEGWLQEDGGFCTIHGGERSKRG